MTSHPVINKKLGRIVIPILIVVVAAGLYLLKNPIGGSADTTLDPAKGEYASAEFDLVATINFNLDKIISDSSI